MPARHEAKIKDNLGTTELVPFKYAITGYGADYPVDSLVNRLRIDDIYVPSFQRGFVWSLKQSSRFIESLLLGLPVPGIFLSKEEDTQKLLVIDGQQRLMTLKFFYDGEFADTGRVFALQGVQKQFEGLTYKTLDDDDRRRLDNSIIHATIINQVEPSDDLSSIYYVFERLNTGGTQLQPQEIRAAINHGEFNDLLKQLNEDENWRAIYGAENLRMRDQELILRFLALYFEGKDYKPPMTEFLNSFMGKNKHLKRLSGDEIRKVFAPTIHFIRKCLGTTAFRRERALNAAVFDSVMIGTARLIVNGKMPKCEAYTARYTKLLRNQAFVDATETGTAREDNVKARLALATEAFQNLG